MDRGSRGFGLSLIYRGLDKYEEKETGIFVARVVPQGQAAKYGAKENDKIISINNKTPRNVDDAVGIIKEAGKSIKLVVVRQEEVPDVVVDDNLSLASENMDSGWVSLTNQECDSLKCKYAEIIDIVDEGNHWTSRITHRISPQLQHQLRAPVT